jgi:hypothetical protein
MDLIRECTLIVALWKWEVVMRQGERKTILGLRILKMVLLRVMTMIGGIIVEVMGIVREEEEVILGVDVEAGKVVVGRIGLTCRSTDIFFTWKLIFLK